MKSPTLELCPTLHCASITTADATVEKLSSAWILVGKTERKQQKIMHAVYLLLLGLFSHF